jgi:ABC-2 type transport system ATP-binding protein
MAHAERLCDRLAIIARSARRFEGTVDDARALLPMQVRYTPRDGSDAVAALLPAGAIRKGEAWHFAIEDNAVEPLLARITASGHGVAGLSIARPALHDAFVHIVRQVDAGFDGDPEEDAIAEDAA